MRNSREMSGLTRGAWWTLFLLVLLLIMSLVDRVILALLLKPLRAQFDFNDLQFGLLFGTAFAVFYAVLGLPVARLADRWNRKYLICLGVMLWSCCTIASAFARSFEELLALRVGLAVGEVALFPAAHSLVADLFPRHQRRLAASILAATPFLGAALTFMGGGFLIAAMEMFVTSGGGGGLLAWQLTLITVGVPTLIIGLLFGATVSEPQRRADVAAEQTVEDPKSRITGWKFFLPLLIGGGAPMIVAYAYSAWGAELLMRKYGLLLSEAGMWFGLSSALGPVIGSLLLPALIREGSHRAKVDSLLRTCLAAVVVGSAIFIAAPLQSSAAVLLLGYLAGSVLLFGAYSSVIVSMQFLAGGRQRATLVASVTLVGSGVGLGVGPPLVGYLNMSLASGYGAALAYCAALAGIVSSVMLAIAWRVSIGPSAGGVGAEWAVDAGRRN